MNAKVSDLKKELERLFESATMESERRSKPKTFPVEMSDETKAAFDSVEKAVNEMIQGALNHRNLLALPEEGTMDDLRLALLFHPYYTFETWHAREDISEATLLAAEKDIRAGRVKKLETLRDQDRKLDYEMPILGETYGRYMRLLNNLSYLFWVWAHQAKRFNSFAAAKHYLRAISLINVRKTRVVPNFSPEDIDALIEYMLDGAEELRLAADYSSLQDWETFREKQSKIFNAMLPEFETCGKKGGK